MNLRTLLSFLILCFIFVVSSHAQIDSLFINGSDTSFTMVSGGVIGWDIKLPNGATANASFWLDVNSNGIIDSSLDVKRIEFTTTDGSSPDGLPDLDGTVNGRIILSVRQGFAPGAYILTFSQGGFIISRRGTVTSLSSPAHAISGHVTAPSGRSARYLWLEAKRSGHIVEPNSWEAYTDSLGDYTIYTDADTTGNPWRVGFVNGDNPFPSFVYSPAEYSFTLTGNPSGMNFSFVSYSAKVVGYAKDENGNPLTNRGVSILKESNNPGLFRSVNTDSSGYFEIGVTESELWDGYFRLASYFYDNTNSDMIGTARIHGIHLGDSLFYNLVSYHVNSSIQGQVLVNGNPPGFPIRIAGSVSDTGYTFTIADSMTGNFTLPVSNRLYNYEVGPDNLVGQYMWNNALAHPGQTGIIINLTGNSLPPQYSININATNGIVTKNPNQPNYDSSVVVELMAIPNEHYVFTGWSGDVSGSANPITVIMNNNKNITAVFGDDPVYQVRYRTFNPDSIALEQDNLGKTGKSVKQKPTSAQFGTLIDSRSAGVNGIHLEFGSAIDTTYEFYTVPPSTRSEVAKSKLAKWNLTFASPLNIGDTIQVYGHSSKGVLQKVSSYWWTNNGVLVGKKLRNPIFSMNILRLPMPNRINVMETVYPDGYPYGMNIGIMQTNKDSAKRYGWVNLKSSGDVLKSLSFTSKGIVNLHDGAARGLDSIVAGKNMKSLVGKQTSLPPTKQDNILFANLVALKLSITASASENTPLGFGELILNDTAANPWNGLTLAQLSAKADTMMRGYPNRTFETAQTYTKLATTVRNILDAFEGVMDTSRWAGGLLVKGTHPLIDCRILLPNSSVAPYRIVTNEVRSAEPEQYALYQNYPNPFNPTTSLSFVLGNSSLVSLKVYDMLGREVAILITNEQMEAGQYDIPFNGTSLASGVYFYRLNVINAETGEVSFNDVKRMLMIK